MSNQQITDPYQEAKDRYWRGDLEGVVDLMTGRPEAEAVLVLARSLRRLSRDAEAVALIDSCDTATWSPASVAEAQLTRAASLIRLNRISEAEILIKRVRASREALTNAGFELELQNTEALLCFAARDLASAKEIARSALARSNCTPPQRYFVPVEHSRAQALECLALVSAASGAYRKQAVYSEAAIDAVERSKPFDAFRHVFVLDTLSAMFREVQIDGSVPFIAHRVETIRAESSLNAPKERVLRNLCVRQLLSGKDLWARENLAHLRESSSEVLIRILAIVDLAFFDEEKFLGRASSDDLIFAEELSEGVPWDDVGEFRAFLLALARELAAVSVTRARRVWQRYRSIKSSLSATLLAAFNSWQVAGEEYVHGLLLRAEGSNDQAVTNFQSAFEKYSVAGFTLRATLAAIELAELTGSQHFGDYAMKEAAVRPDSWLARRVHLSRIQVARGI